MFFLYVKDDVLVCHKWIHDHQHVAAHFYQLMPEMTLLMPQKRYITQLLDYLCFPYDRC